MKERPPQSRPENNNPFRWGRLVLWLCLSVPLYVLSIGPVTWLVTKGYLGSPTAVKWLDFSYAPVFWVIEHTPLQKPLENYAEWWDASASQTQPPVQTNSPPSSLP